MENSARILRFAIGINTTTTDYAFQSKGSGFKSRKTKSWTLCHLVCGSTLEALRFLLKMSIFKNKSWIYISVFKQDQLFPQIKNKKIAKTVSLTNVTQNGVVRAFVGDYF